MRERTFEEETQYTWIVYVIATLLVGGLGGYILAATAGSTSSRAPVVTVTHSNATTGTVLDEGALRAYRDILSRDPKNVGAAVGAGNLLYDAKRYIEAIPYYQQALAIKADDINVSTDLGTALW